MAIQKAVHRSKCWIFHKVWKISLKTDSFCIGKIFLHLPLSLRDHNLKKFFWFSYIL